jgi:NAD(P)-dependent dehydrogenase (short-subunit alcohol dehydrogenase family)
MLMTMPQTTDSLGAPRPLDGRSAIVTGSTSGIGLGIARALAQAGACVMLNGFGEAREIEKIRAELAKAYGREVRFNAADVSRPASIAEMVEAADAAFGKVDILVNNAGIQHAAGGCNIDDPPPAARLHASKDQPAGVKGGAEIDGQDGIPFLHGKILQRRPASPAMPSARAMS